MIKKIKKSFPFVALFILIVLAFAGIVHDASICVTNTVLTEHEQQAVEAVSYYKSILKDPCSLRIFGDIHLLKSNSDGNGFIVIYADAKNSYGGYGGKEPIEITCIYADETIKENTFIARDSNMEGYNNIADSISEYAKYADDKMPLTYYKVDGEKVAKAIGAEFIEWER